MDAGEFASWLAGAVAAIRDDRTSDVPCGDCTACCTSSQFVLVEADEADTLRHVPPALRFPAPGRPAGDLVLGYDERGHCPMFVDGGCSIYDHRPRACRRYDCRVFAAAGVEPDQPAVAVRVRAWEFTYASDASRAAHDAVRSAATRLRAEPDAPASATQVAVRAIERVTR